MTTNFYEEHLPAIMRSIENELSRFGLTVKDFNDAEADTSHVCSS